MVSDRARQRTVQRRDERPTRRYPERRPVIEKQGEYLRLQAQDESDNWGSNNASVARFEFPPHTFKWQKLLHNGKVRSERSGFRTAFGGGLPAHVTRQYPKRR